MEYTIKKLNESEIEIKTDIEKNLIDIMSLKKNKKFKK